MPNLSACRVARVVPADGGYHDQLAGPGRFTCRPSEPAADVRCSFTVHPPVVSIIGAVAKSIAARQDARTSHSRGVGLPTRPSPRPDGSAKSSAVTTGPRPALCSF